MKTRYAFPLLCLLGTLCLSACAVGRDGARRETTLDSLITTDRLRVSASLQPPSRAELAVPLARLGQLPATGQSSHAGQATAHVRLVRDTLYVTATCDSLQRLVYEYERAASRHRAQSLATRQETTARGGGFPLWLPLALLGAILVVRE